MGNRTSLGKAIVLMLVCAGIVPSVLCIVTSSKIGPLADKIGISAYWGIQKTNYVKNKISPPPPKKKAQ